MKPAVAFVIFVVVAVVVVFVVAVPCIVQGPHECIACLR